MLLSWDFLDTVNACQMHPVSHACLGCASKTGHCLSRRQGHQVQGPAGRHCCCPKLALNVGCALTAGTVGAVQQRLLKTGSWMRYGWNSQAHLDDECFR